MAWALEQRVVTDATARHVLLVLANYADHEGRGAFPSVGRIAEETGLSERTIRAKLGDLRESRVIRPGNQRLAEVHIARGDLRPTVYDLAMERGAADAPRRATGCISRTNGVQMAHERGAGAAPDPSLIHQGSNTHPRAGESPAGFACRLMRAAGCLTTNPSHPKLVDALIDGVEPQALADTVRELIDGGTNEREAFPLAIATAHGRLRDSRKPKPQGARHAPTRRLSPGEEVRAAIASRTGFELDDVIDADVIDAEGRRLA